MRPFHRILSGSLMALLLLTIWVSSPIRSHIPLEPGYWISVGETQEWGDHLPDWLKPYLSLQVEGDAQSVFSNNVSGAVAVGEENPLQIQAIHAGQTRVSLMLWETIPLQTVEIEAVEPKYLIPGGHSIGVMVHSDGIMVVGFAAITERNGQKICPAGEAGLEIGDRIVAVNEQPIASEDELSEVIHNTQGQAVRLEIVRNEEKMFFDLQPVFCPETNRFRIGLYVRDQVAGIGTLSFWDPITHAYAALGHIILDADTRQAIEVGEGQIVSAPVRSIQPGLPGSPGEKVGVFQEEGEINGNILKNSLCGIYGLNPSEIHNELNQNPMEVAYGRQVHVGKAEIFTVLEDEQIERFEVEIIRLYPGRTNGKNMLIKVTDPRLLNVTGGIIQGMSGSPIIQDGRLIGAVTHVLLNDPTRGYGVFMDHILENMPVLDAYQP